MYLCARVRGRVPRFRSELHLTGIQGRNNLFHALLVLLWFVRERHGHLDEFAERHLGPYGLNILRVLAWR